MREDKKKNDERKVERLDRMIIPGVTGKGRKYIREKSEKNDERLRTRWTKCHRSKHIVNLRASQNTSQSIESRDSCREVLVSTASSGTRERDVVLR